MGLQPPPPALVVSRVEGPVLRGVGPSLGRRAALVRFGGCNLACDWCDSRSDWDGSRYDLAAELRQRLVRTIAAEALGHGPAVVVLTGGEPMLHQHREGWAELLGLFAEARIEVEVETNGTVAPSEVTGRGVSMFVVSPKLANSGMPAWTRLEPGALAAYAALARAGRALFSVVVVDTVDVGTSAQLGRLHGIPADAMSVTPRDGLPAADVAAIAAAVLEEGIAFMPRLGLLAATTP